MKKHLLLTMAILASCHAMAEKTYTLPEDTTKVIDIEEVVVIASPKETSKLRQLPTSVSLISQKDMQANRITSLKSASSIVPNFFIPDYGSRLTSAMYIRGIGSRINTPAVGMYVDNIPYLDKSAFDFNFYDIERIDILRGPQGTLYGRNTMGGLVKVHTRSPFSYQGTDVKLSYGTKNNHRSASLTHYHRISERFAFSAGGYYEGADGFFTNTHLNKKVDEMQAGGGRIRAIWFASDNWKFDFNVNYDYTDEGGYPYYYTGKLAGEEDRADLLNRIAYNRESSYRRSLLNTGLNIEHQAENFIFNAVTGFQHLNDRMHMDQDFSPMDTYTIEQKQRINSITEEITFKSKPGKAWQWTTGVFGFYQNMNVNSPVTFLKDGMGMLNQMLGSVIPGKIEVSMGQGMAMNILPSLVITDTDMPIDGHFKTPQYNAALFHQSQFRDLFGMKGLSFTAGLRLDYEHMQMNYNSGTSLNYTVGIKGEMTRNGQVMREIEMMPSTPLIVESRYMGKLSKDYIQLLPKFALQYDFHNGKSNVYASVSKGHRSGGYNYQMFSELLQSSLKNDMMRQSKNEIMDKAGNYAGMVGEYFPEAGENPEVQAAVEYKPEYTWSYELGTHLSLFDGKLQADMAAFYMQTYDQQISKMAISGLGRITENAGESESYGVEANLVASLNKNLQLNASYGYTKATFVKYEIGDPLSSAEPAVNYNGNYVPFVPMHTLNLGGSYAFFFNEGWAQSLTIGANCTGAGKIYWTEANNASQDFYTSLNGYISLKTKAVQIDLWGRNLTNNDYTTFYFETMGRGYEQRCKPLQVGVDVRLHF